MAPKAKKVVEAPVEVVDVVSEAELAQIVADRAALKDLANTVAATKKRLEAQEAAVIARLRKGAKVQGSLVAIVNMVKGRVTLSWKDMCQKVCIEFGKDFNAFEKTEKDAKAALLKEEPELTIGSKMVEQYGSNLK